MTDQLQQTDEQTPMTAQTIRSVPIEDIKGQVQDIQRVMDSLMQEGTHYDDVTGDGRNSLLQPGAEKLCFAFQFAPSFESERREISPSEVPNAEGEVQGHREYEVECRLHHRPSGEYIGSGRGSCSTLESKYRYRKIDEETEVPIPGDFWDSYDDSMANADFSILEEELIGNGVDIPEGGEAGVTKNDDGEWRITVQAKGENPDIADQYNTVLKMAEKRALVNAVKRCTAASDIFTQDTEDLAVRSGSNVKRDTSGKAQRGNESRSTRQTSPSQSTNTRDRATPNTNERVERYGYALTKGQAERLERRDEGLSDREGDELASAIASVEEEMQDWPNEHLCNACDAMLDQHRQRLADQQAQNAEEAAAANDEPEAEPADGPEPLPDNFPGRRYLVDAGLTTVEDVQDFVDEPNAYLTDIDGIGEQRAEDIQQRLEEKEVFEDPADEGADLPF